MDQIHLWVTAGASLLFALLFILLPLKFSKVGREEGATALPLLAYFSCLGAGFITLELVFIQKFMHLIGSPLYTYSTVIFTLLLGAGIGSAASERLGIGSQRRWAFPFVAIIVIGLALIAIYPPLAKLALAFPLPGRAAVAAVMIFPLGFFLGMPFPLGILAIANQPRGAIAWAWGMNGLFTVIGGLASVFLGLELGFNFTIVIALALYACALAVYRKMRDTVSRGVFVPLDSKDPMVTSALVRCSLAAGGNGEKYPITSVSKPTAINETIRSTRPHAGKIHREQLDDRYSEQNGTGHPHAAGTAACGDQHGRQRQYRPEDRQRRLHQGRLDHRVEVERHPCP